MWTQDRSYICLIFDLFKTYNLVYAHEKRKNLIFVDSGLLFIRGTRWRVAINRNSVLVRVVLGLPRSACARVWDGCLKVLKLRRERSSLRSPTPFPQLPSGA